MSATADFRPTIYVTAICRTCRRRHEIQANDLTYADRMREWHVKHPASSHDIEFINTRRHVPRGFCDKLLSLLNVTPWFMRFRPNADIKLAYGSSAAFTITLTSLATSSTYTAGRQSTIVDNTTNLFIGALVGGKVKVASSGLAAGEVRCYAFGSLNDTPDYPDQLAGIDATRSFTTANQRAAGTSLHVRSATDATASRTYHLKAINIAPAFNQVMPKKWGIWVSHSTGQNLTATASDHAWWYTPIYLTG